MYIRISFAYRTGSFVSENTAVSPPHIRALFRVLSTSLPKALISRSLHGYAQTQKFHRLELVSVWREKGEAREMTKDGAGDETMRRKEMESKGRDLITRHRSRFSGCFHPSSLFSVSILLAFPFHALSLSSIPSVFAHFCHQPATSTTTNTVLAAHFARSSGSPVGCSYLGTRIPDKFLDVGLFQTRRPHENIRSS